ncbi:hypothetical protein C5167_002249 [Papaver somniferum]|uniref:Uncharacterized protein n=1 Tax=Papaver somniferum TaxID=3469 RepID=A0A4Y7L115_PAPSO|nr:hypothetical protein C5167_002249 [Papaver somniferum]
MMDLVAGPGAIAVIATVAASVKTPVASVVVLFQHGNQAPVDDLATNLQNCSCFQCPREREDDVKY